MTTNSDSKRAAGVALQLSGVSKRYGARTVLNNTMLHIEPGEFVAIVGRSGCGKSTLLRLVAGLEAVSGGTIRLDGKAVDGLSEDTRIMFQDSRLLPWKRVADNVALGLQFAGLGRAERRERAQELLRLVGLQDFADAAPYELSGGMRQRVGLARALAPNPDILLMDEPFGALDSMTREQMQELLVSVWARTGKRVFFITHSIEEALFLGTELIVMSPRPGRVVARFDLDFVRTYARDGDARAIKTSPAFAQLREEIRAIVHQSETLEETTV